MIECVEQIGAQNEAVAFERHLETLEEAEIEIVHAVAVKRVSSEDAAARIADRRRAESFTRQSDWRLIRHSKMGAQNAWINEGGASFGESVEVEIAEPVAIDDGERCAGGEFRDHRDLPAPQQLSGKIVALFVPRKLVSAEEGEAVRRVKARQAARNTRVGAEDVRIARAYKRRFGSRINRLAPGVRHLECQPLR